jgi:hypothetical protein
MNYFTRNLFIGFILCFPLMILNGLTTFGIYALATPIVAGLAVGYVARTSSEEEIE